MAATRPSIMSLGATTSAPDCAYATAARARSGSVWSLATATCPRASRASGPQCPWSVYSHRHTSAMATTSGAASLMALNAVHTGPLGSHAPVPCASLWSGMPNRITLRTPAALAVVVSSTIRSTESCATPGMEPIGLRTPRPLTANSGRIRSDGWMRVSRTMERSAAVRRSRRGRSLGKAIGQTVTPRHHAAQRPAAPWNGAQPGSHLVPHAEGCGVLAGLDQQGAIDGAQDGRVGETRVPAGQVVAELHGGGAAHVDGELQPDAHLVGVGEVTQVVLRQVRVWRDRPLQVPGQGDAREEAHLELDVRVQAEDADGGRASLGAAHLVAGEEARAGDEDDAGGDARGGAHQKADGPVEAGGSEALVLGLEPAAFQLEASEVRLVLAEPRRIARHAAQRLQRVGPEPRPAPRVDAHREQRRLPGDEQPRRRGIRHLDGNALLFDDRGLLPGRRFGESRSCAAEEEDGQDRSHSATIPVHAGAVMR